MEWDNGNDCCKTGVVAHSAMIPFFHQLRMRSIYNCVCLRGLYRYHRCNGAPHNLLIISVALKDILLRCKLNFTNVAAVLVIVVSSAFFVAIVVMNDATATKADATAWEKLQLQQ